MKTAIRMMVVAAGLFVTHVLMGQAPAGAPAGATGLCKDGSYWTGASKQGACRGHQGVKDWYASDSGGGTGSKGTSAAPASSSSSKAAAPAAATAPAAAAAPAPAPKSTAKTTTTTASNGTPAPGGGPGLVWVNTDSKVYHCYGTKYYGTTKQGKYMSEADAKSSGARPDHGNACSK
jgi:hypothetical protein